MSKRGLSYAVCWARLAIYAVSFGTLLSLVPGLRQTPFPYVAVWSLVYALLLLVWVPRLTRRHLTLWLGLSLVSDFGTVALAQWWAGGTNLHTVYFAVLVFYAFALGRRASLLILPLPLGLMFGVDAATGRLPAQLPMDLSLAGVMAVTAWILGGLSDERERLRRQLARAAVTDDLTGLYNARYFFQQLERCLEEARHTGQPVTIALLDADGFKAINDNLGHLAGDRVLRACGQALAEVVQSPGVAVRYGGDEFALILPGADKEQALPIVESGIAAMARAAAAEVGDRYVLTFCAGLADSTSTTDPRRLFALADERLYAGKRQPREGRAAAWSSSRA